MNVQSSENYPRYNVIHNPLIATKGGILTGGFSRTLSAAQSGTPPTESERPAAPAQPTETNNCHGGNCAAGCHGT